MSTLREEFEAWKRTMDSGYEAWQAVEWATERAAKVCDSMSESDYSPAQCAAAIRGAEKEGAKGS